MLLGLFLHNMVDANSFCSEFVNLNMENEVILLKTLVIGLKFCLFSRQNQKSSKISSEIVVRLKYEDFFLLLVFDFLHNLVHANSSFLANF